MAIEFIQLNEATSTGARIAHDLVTGASASDAVHYQAVQLVKGADGAAKTLITSGAGMPVEELPITPDELVRRIEIGATGVPLTPHWVSEDLILPAAHWRQVTEDAGEDQGARRQHDCRDANRTPERRIGLSCPDQSGILPM